MDVTTIRPAVCSTWEARTGSKSLRSSSNATQGPKLAWGPFLLVSRRPQSVARRRIPFPRGRSWSHRRCRRPACPLTCAHRQAHHGKGKIMNRIEYRLLAGVLAAAIGFAPVAPATRSRRKDQAWTGSGKIARCQSALARARGGQTQSGADGENPSGKAHGRVAKPYARRPADRPRPCRDHRCVMIMALPIRPAQQAHTPDCHAHR